MATAAAAKVTEVVFEWEGRDRNGKQVRGETRAAGENQVLAALFRKYPLYFDSLYCNLVEAGEAAGILETLLDRLAVYMEKTEAIKSKIKSALMYPIAVMV